MAAFVDVLAASAGEAGRWIHYGLTSSDVLDTALALQLRAAGEVRDRRRARARRGARRARARARGTLCVGRTHGVHAEPTTFGVKLAGFAFEAHRNAARLQRAFAQVAVGALSGAVGTYAATEPRVRGARARAPRPRARGRLDPGRRPRPPRRAAERDRARRRRARALRDRGPPPAAHRGARGAGAVPRRARRAPRRCRTSATRSRAEQISGLARVLRGNAQAGARERRAVARARHLALLGRAGDPARLDDPARLPAAPRDRARRRA